MLLCKFFIIFLSVFAFTKSEIPLYMKNGMKNAKTLEEFLSFLATPNDTRDANQDFQRGSLDIPAKCDLNDTCILTSVCVPVYPDKKDIESPFFPSCIKLARCIDSSHDHQKFCKPANSTLKFKVLHFKHIGSGQGYFKPRLVTMQNHTECVQEIKSAMETF